MNHTRPTCLLLLILLLSACAARPIEPPVSTATPLPGATTTATNTATPAPSMTPTTPPSPTVTLSPTVTPISMLEVGNLTVPDPRHTVPEMFDPQKPDAPISRYVHALKSAGIEITVEQVVQELQFQQLEDQDDYSSVVALTADGTPLLFAEKDQDGEWKPWSMDTLKPLFERIGILTGALVNTSEPYQNPSYQARLANNFHIVLPDGDFYQDTIDRLGAGKAAAQQAVALRNHQILYIHAGFFRYDQKYLENQTLDQRLTKLRNRAKTVLGFAKRVDGKTQTQPTIVNIFNEPFGRYISESSGEDIATWKVESIAQQTWGADTLIESYVLFYNEAQIQGLRVGEDVLFVFTEYGVNTDNPKTHLALRELDRARKEIAERLNLPIEQVQFGVSLEQRYDESNPLDLPNSSLGRVRPPTEEELASTTKQFMAVAAFVMFTECSDTNASPEQRQARFRTLLKVGSELGVKAIIFENPLRFTSEEPDLTYRNTDLFTPQYAPSAGYFDLAQYALSIPARER